MEGLRSTARRVGAKRGSPEGEGSGEGMPQKIF